MLSSRSLLVHQEPQNCECACPQTAYTEQSLLFQAMIELLYAQLVLVLVLFLIDSLLLLMLLIIQSSQFGWPRLLALALCYVEGPSLLEDTEIVCRINNY